MVIGSRARGLKRASFPAPGYAAPAASPASRKSAGEQILRRVEAALPVAAMKAAILGNLHMGDGQLVDEARGNRLLPHAVGPAVLGEGNLGP